MKQIIIIPTYNEKENIEKMIRKVFSLPKNFDILVVDDNSPDGTAAIVETLKTEFGEKLRILNRKKKEGLGLAYIAGFKHCLSMNYDFIFEMDADFSHDPEEMPNMLSALQDGADLVIGSRYINGVNVVNWPMSRVILSYYASAYVRFITGMTIRDSTAGFVGYKKKVLETIPLDKIKFKGYAFQIEMKFKTWKRGFKIKEIPIIFRDRTEGQSKMSGGIVKEAFFGVIELKIRSLFGKF